jgi:hypothetical protein
MPAMTGWGVTRRASLADLAAVVVVVTGGALIGYFGRYWSFFYDEWGTILFRRSGGLDAFLAPHNGHLQATVIAIYRVLFASVGLHSYRPYQLAVIGAHMVAVGLVFVFARQRIGGWPAVALIVPVVLLASAWQVLFWGINVGFVFPVISLLVLLLVRRPWVVGVVLSFALASSGLGVAVAAVAFVLAIRESRRKTHLLAWALPVIGYALWWWLYRPHALPPASLRDLPGASATGDVGTINFPSANIHRSPSYIVASAKAAAEALTGTGRAWSWWPLTAVTVIVVIAVAQRRTVSARLVALTIGLLAFWTETALTRAQFASPQSSGTSRYLYPGAIFLMLILIESLTGIPIKGWTLAVMAAVVTAIAVSDLHNFTAYERASRIAFAAESKALRQARCGPPRAASSPVDPLRAPGLTYGPYLAAIHALGGPPHTACLAPR